MRRHVQHEGPAKKGDGSGALANGWKGRNGRTWDTCVVLGLGTKKDGTRSPANTRPPESHEHQDVFRQYVAPSTGCSCGGIADETNMTDLFHRVGHGEGDGYALCC